MVLTVDRPEKRPRNLTELENLLAEECRMHTVSAHIKTLKSQETFLTQFNNFHENEIKKQMWITSACNIMVVPPPRKGMI